MTTTAASVPWPRKKTVEEPQPATQGDGVAPSSSSSSSPASGQSGITAVDPPLHPDGNGQEEEDCEDWEGCDAPDCCRIVDSSTLPPVIATSSDPERQPLLSASHTHANTHIRYSSTTTNVSRPRSLSSTNTPRPLLRPSTTRPTYSKINPCSHTQQLLLAGLGQLAEQKRGRWFLGMFVGVLGSAWGVFLGGVMWKLARR